MKTTVYNKLVRDRIPEIIAANGAEAVTRALTPTEFVQALKEKLIEEAREIAGATSPEELRIELADALEIIHALIDATQIPLDGIERTRRERVVSRGAFMKRTLLIETRE